MIEGHALEGLEEHRFNLSQLFWLKELLDPDRVEELEKASGSVPASDRVVTLDHNSGAYVEATDALQTLERALREANDYPEPEEREQHIAEVSATWRLLQSVRVRIVAVVAVAKAPLTFLIKKFADKAIGKAAAVAVEKLAALIGTWWSGG